jgi:hypothetical protein
MRVIFHSLYYHPAIKVGDYIALLNKGGEELMSYTGGSSRFAEFVLVIYVLLVIILLTGIW